MDRLNSIIDSINAFAWGPPLLGVTGVLPKSGLVFMSWRRVGDGFRLLFDKETVGQGWISINGSGNVRWCRLSCIERTGAVQVHPSRNQEVSLRRANAAGKWPVPEIGLVEGLTVEMMGGRVCMMVAG